MKFGKVTGFGLSLIALLISAQSVAMAQAPTADAAIKDRVVGFVKAYNGRNAANLSDFFTDDANLIDVDGGVIRGKAGIGAQFATGFAASSNYTLESSVE